MPIRMLRDWTRSKKMASLTAQGERLFIRLIMVADDLGNYPANIKLMNGNLFSEFPDVRDSDVSKWFDECIKAGVIRVYTSDGTQYVHIVDFGQRLDKAKAKYPQPGENDFLKPPGKIPELPGTSGKIPPELETETEIETEIEREVVSGKKFTADESATLDTRTSDFMQKVAEHTNAYDRQMLREFFDYWTEKNEGGRRMRFEMQKVFDISRRLKTWARNQKIKTNGKPTSITAQGTLDRLNSYRD